MPVYPEQATRKALLAHLHWHLDWNTQWTCSTNIGSNSLPSHLLLGHTLKLWSAPFSGIAPDSGEPQRTLFEDLGSPAALKRRVMHFLFGP